MLPAALRMRRSDDFARTIRSGARAGRGTLVVHCRVAPGRSGRRVGFVVARTVGGAVVRNRVRRRLRGVVVEELTAVPDGADVVVRALPPSALADYPTLRDDFRSAMSSAGRKGVARAADRVSDQR